MSLIKNTYSHTYFSNDHLSIHYQIDWYNLFSRMSALALQTNTEIDADFLEKLSEKFRYSTAAWGDNFDYEFIAFCNEYNNFHSRLMREIE
jgi:hypothetical protein